MSAAVKSKFIAKDFNRDNMCEEVKIMNSAIMTRKKYFMPETYSVIVKIEHTILSGGDQQSGGSENPETGQGF